jgi:hypothetical protein
LEVSQVQLNCFLKPSLFFDPFGDYLDDVGTHPKIQSFD